MKRFLVWVMTWAIAIGAAEAAESRGVQLPPRPAKSGADVVAALEQRRTTREFAATPLSMEDVSALLWAANGVNRADGRRTAPTAMNRQYIDIYLVGEAGAYRYDAPAHALVAVTDANVKERMGRQAHVAAGSHILVFVADTPRIPGSEESRLLWAHSTAGAMAENVHLMAAARGIGTGIVAGIKAEEIRRSLSLSPEAVPLYVMPLGYLKK